MLAGRAQLHSAHRCACALHRQTEKKRGNVGGERTAEEALRLAAKDINWVPTREHVQSRSISASLLPHDPFATPLRTLRANARAVLDAYLAARPSPPPSCMRGRPMMSTRVKFEKNIQHIQRSERRAHRLAVRP